MWGWYAARRRSLRLVAVLVVGSVLLGASALVSIQTFAHGLLAPGTVTITRPQMLARAQTWVDARVPYNQAGWFRGYREDCSGFVSMAWELSQSYTTYTLNQVAHPITKAELQPGDVLNKATDVGGSAHVVLFVGWTDASHTAYNAYEENPYWGGAHFTTDIPYPYWPGSYRSVTDYMPMRLNGLAASTSAPSAPAAAPPAANPAATLAPPLPSTLYLTDANGTLHALDAQHAHELWRYQTGGTLDALSVAGGQVLTATAGQAVDAQGDRPLALVALNATSGASLWQWRPNCLVGPHTAPLTCGIVGQTASTVYVATGSAITALDLASGTPRWTYTIGTDTLSGFAIAGTTLYVSHTSAAASDPASHPDVSRHAAYPAPLAALDALIATNGARLWSAPTVGGVADGMLAVASGIVYAGVQSAPDTGQASSLSSVLQAFDGRTGSALWQSAIATTSLVLPASGGAIYLTTAPSGQATGLLALAAHNGQRLWTQPCGASAPIVTSTAVYAVCGGANAVLQVAALDPSTGHILWQHAVGANVDQLALAAVADGIVYAISTSTSASAPAAATGTISATATSESTVAAAGQATASTSTTTVTTTTALDARAGTVLWQRAGTLAAAARGLACVVSADGTLTVLAARTNKLSWLFELGANSTGGHVAITA